jgi:glycosyltransferase involved in cell wall biosynthesis
MRVVLFAEPLEKQHAGIHVYTREMIRALLQYDQKNEYILLRSKKDHFFPEAQQVVVPNVFKAMRNDPLRLMLNVPQVLKRLQPDWVVEPAQFGPIRVPAKSKKISICHDLTPVLFPVWHTRTSSVLQRLFLKNIYDRTDIIVANSNNTKNDLVNMDSSFEEKTVRIYPGLSEVYSSMTYTPLEKEDFFLHLGTFEPRKNISGIIRVFDAFKKRTGAATKFKLIGAKGWKMADTNAAIKESPYVSDIKVCGFLGDEEVAQNLKSCKAFIINSLYEGFGFPLLEAMHFGANCFVSKNSSLTEVGGDYVHYHSSEEELLENLIALGNQSSNDLGAMQAHVSSFSWKKFAEDFSKLLGD